MRWAPGGLALTGLLAVALARVPIAWRGIPRTTLVAVAALSAFTVWSYSSTAWADDREWAGLGLPAFAMLGLACSLAPRRGTSAVVRGSTRRPAVLGVGCLVLAIPLTGLWLSRAAQGRAVAAFRAGRPATSYRLLDRAAALDPLTARPATLEGSIAVRLGDVPRADAAFGRALRRVPGEQYAALERGAIASARGDRLRARALLTRAAALAPRDALTREALAVVRRGGTVDVVELNRRIYVNARGVPG